MPTEEPRWGTRRRFEFIEWRLYWMGRINRGDIEERFNVSTPQASVDLRDYQSELPENIEYNPKEKAYLPTQRFRPKYLQISSDRYLVQLEALLRGAVQMHDTWFGSPPPAAVMGTAKRSVAPETLQLVLRAIENRRRLEIEYLSLSSTKVREIEPHAIASDGNRWHTRAWCPDNREFRDFVLTRIVECRDAGESSSDPTRDVEWTKFVTLRIGPHPKLNPAQRRAIEHDFGMESGETKLEVRTALAYYAIRNLNLDLGKNDTIDPVRLQIVLLNHEEVDSVVQAATVAARAEGNAPNRPT